MRESIGDGDVEVSDGNRGSSQSQQKLANGHTTTWSQISYRDSLVGKESMDIEEDFEELFKHRTFLNRGAKEDI